MSGGGSRTSALAPGRNGPDDVGRGEMEGPYRHVLAVLHLDDDAGAERVLALPVELDPVPRHDQLIARDVRLRERPLDRLRLRRSGPVDRVGESEDPGECPRGVAGEVHLVAGLEEIVRLLD